MKSIIKKILYQYFLKRSHKSHKNLYKKIIANQPELNEKTSGELDWLSKWRKIDKKVTPFSYRIFSRYLGEDLNIVPLETCDTYIEPVLNPVRYRPYYNDKNVFDRLFEDGVLPKSIIRNINGKFYDSVYNSIAVVDSLLTNYLSTYKQIIIKPTVGAQSGMGVQLFTKKDNYWVDNLGNKLSIDYLVKKYNENFIIQECLTQNEFLAQFNATSVNTIRIMTYRSVKNDEIIIPNAILRIGRSGSFVDNAHAGGRFIGINEKGCLGKYTCDYLGKKQNIFNGIDFSKETFVIPDYDKVLIFAKEIANKIIFHRLLGLDIMLDKYNNPRLIEFNSAGFGTWLFQFTTGPAFKQYTDEVINYVFDKQKATSVITILEI